jgi:hypothetical protein
MDVQLRLTAEGTGAEPVLLSIDVLPEQLERFRALRDGERFEFEVRAPGVLAELVDRIGYLVGLKTYELRHLASDLQRDLYRVKKLLAERYDAERCPECRVHLQNGHLLTCELGRAA